jgi:hypothetical protein
MAIIKSHIFFILLDGPSCPRMKCSWGRSLSTRSRQIAPPKRLIATTYTPYPGHNRLPCSMPGTIRENDVAASMTPAAPPSKVLISLISLSGTLLKNKAGRAPTPVARPARRLAIRPVATRDMWLPKLKNWLINYQR